MRVFKGKLQDSDIYAGAISRPGHRLVNAVAAENPDFDVSQAFCKGMALEELLIYSGQVTQKVEFDASKIDIERLRQLLDFID